MRSTTLLEYPHSLSYQLTSLTKLGDSEMPAVASKMDDRSSPMKSAETTASSVYPMMPLRLPFLDASSMVAQISSYYAPFSMRTVRSTTETSWVGTRNAMPVSLPLSAGENLADGFRGAGAGRDDVGAGTAPAAPVLHGRAVHGLLRRGGGVHRGHQTFDDAVVVVDDL